MYTNFTKKLASVEEKMFEFTKKVHTCSYGRRKSFREIFEMLLSLLQDKI